MHAVVDEDVSDVHLFWYYLSSISGLITIIINSILLIHVIYHYHSKHEEGMRPNKSLHILTCLYFIFGMFSSICFGLIRSNVFTYYLFASINDFTSIQCGIGYFGCYIFQILAKCVLYYLLLRRIQIVFKNSTYDYSENFYNFLYKIVVPIAPFIIISLIFIGRIIYPSEIEWILHYHYPSNMIYCGASSDFNEWIIAALIFGVIYDFCLTSTLVFAFLKCLYALRMDTLQQHLAEVNMKRSIPTETPITNETANSSTNHSTKDPVSPSISPRSSIIMDKPQINMKRSMDIVIEEYDQSTKSEKDSIKKLIILLTLSKKQTILACIAIISTFLFVILSLFVTKISLQISLDILINSICVWLMDGAAKNQWNWFTKYCCCYICYRKIHIITKRNSFWNNQ